MIVKREKLKGGSLSHTSLLTFKDGHKVVRKANSRYENREYGIVRWHSQMKRLQRYNFLFPQLFPVLLDVSIEDDQAYFDIEFISGGEDLKIYICSPDRTSAEIERAEADLWAAMEQLHNKASFPKQNALSLYFQEEVLLKLNHALENKQFNDFYHQDNYHFNGEIIPSLKNNIQALEEMFAAASPPSECFTHGNITLENILYNPNEGKIIFIDPYDENIIDCREAEYSQILQCSKSHYGYVNDRDVTDKNGHIYFNGTIPNSLKYFNELFQNRLKATFDSNTLQLVSLFEFSQFVRMLPFKVAAGDDIKAKYFLCLAAKLATQLTEHLTQKPTN